VDVYRIAADGGAMKNLTPDFDLIPTRRSGKTTPSGLERGGRRYSPVPDERERWKSGADYQRRTVRSEGSVFQRPSTGWLMWLRIRPIRRKRFPRKTDATGETKLTDFSAKFLSDVI